MKKDYDLLGLLARFLRDEVASTAAEYVIIASLISIIIITVIAGIGTSMNNMYFQNIQSGLTR